jgi:tRNA (guanine9-N1)-methyltransferase
MTDLIESNNNETIIKPKEEEEEKSLTKTQLKRKKKLENILKIRIEKRKKERENKKLKRSLKKQYPVENEEIAISRKSLKKNIMINSTNKLRIIVDCSFEQLMQDNDISHLCKQLQFCYAANRRLKSPLQFYITDYKSKLKTMLDRMGGSNWDIHRSEESYLKLFSNEIEKGNVCYLTSDSPNELEEFDENKVYIIGGK